MSCGKVSHMKSIAAHHEAIGAVASLRFRGNQAYGGVIHEQDHVMQFGGGAAGSCSVRQRNADAMNLMRRELRREYIVGDAARSGAAAEDDAIRQHVERRAAIA